MSWTGGSMQGGGTTEIRTGATLDITGADEKSLDDRFLDNSGTIHFSSSSPLSGLTSTINNRGLFEIESDQPLLSADKTFDNGGTLTINNSGRLRKPTGGASTSQLACVVTNDGTIEVLDGTLVLSGELTNLAQYTLSGGRYV